MSSTLGITSPQQAPSSPLPDVFLLVTWSTSSAASSFRTSCLTINQESMHQYGVMSKSRQRFTCQRMPGAYTYDFWGVHMCVWGVRAQQRMHVGVPRGATPWTRFHSTARSQHVHSTFTARAHTLQQLEPHSRRPRGTAWVPARGLPDRQMDASREAA